MAIISPEFRARRMCTAESLRNASRVGMRGFSCSWQPEQCCSKTASPEGVCAFTIAAPGEIASISQRSALSRRKPIDPPGLNHAIVLIHAFQFDRRGVAFHFDDRSERPRQIRQPLENVTRLLALRRLWQTTRLEKEIVGELVLRVRLSSANLIHHDRLKRNGSQIFSLELDVCDDAFPDDGLVKKYGDRRQVKNKVEIGRA